MTIERFIELWASNPENFMVKADQDGHSYMGKVKTLVWDLEGPTAGVLTSEFFREEIVSVHLSNLTELTK